MEINYPIICIKKSEPMVYGFRDARSFTIADEKLVDLGFFEGVYIIDSLGIKYIVEKVIKVGWATPWWGYSFKRKGRAVKVNFQFRLLERINLSDLRNEIYDRVIKSEYFIETYSFDELSDKIQKANSLKDLIEFFS